MNSSKLKKGVLAVILLASSSLYFAVLNPQRFGSYYDDSIYVTTAKALATNQGYRIISLPYEPVQTLYPPLYPLFLSVIWRVYPKFPDNIFWMMIFSIVATVGFLALTYRYLTKYHYMHTWAALIVIGIAGINWRTMLLATTLLSELTYAVLSVVALSLAETVDEDRTTLKSVALAGLGAGFAFLTRTSGAALFGAFVLYYVLRKQWRQSLVAGTVGAIFVIGWSAWCYSHRTEVTGINTGYFTSYWHMFRESFQTLRSLNDTSPVATFLNILGTNFLLLLVASPALACFGIRYDLPQALLLFLVSLTFITIVTGFIRRFKRGPRLLEIYVSLYLLLHLLPAGVAYDRYLLPIVPFLLYYIVSEASAIISSIKAALNSGKFSKRLGAGSLGFALVVIIGVLLYSNVSMTYASLASASSANSDQWAVDPQAIEWVRENTSQSDILACYRDPLFYLFTGRKAVISSPLILFNTVPYQTRKPSQSEFGTAFLKLVQESNSNYVILSRDDFKFESDQYRICLEELISERRETFIRVFQSQDGRSEIYRIENKTTR